MLLNFGDNEERKNHLDEEREKGKQPDPKPCPEVFVEISAQDRRAYM
jgi:hypothetical protein